MKRFYEIAAVVGTLLMSTGLVACGTTAENVTRTDMGTKETTAVKILLAEEYTEAVTEAEIAEEETIAVETETIATVETVAETEAVQPANNNAVTAAPQTTAAPKATTKATTKKVSSAAASPSASPSAGNSPSADNSEPDLEPAPAPEPEPAPAPIDPADDIPPEPEAPEEPLPTAPPLVSLTDADFVFQYGGQSLTLKQSADAFVAAVPPRDTLEAPSCLGNGTDVNYVYDGFTVFTWKDESGVSQVNGIEITQAGFTTSKGISVGSTVDDLVAAYGSLVMNGYVCNYNDYSLKFVVEDNIVKKISYDA